MAKVKVTIHNDGSTESVEVNKTLFTLGRSMDCDVALADPNVSRLHATVEVVDGKVYIEDKNSSNGTLVNQKRIGALQPVLLKKGDTVQFGKSPFAIVIDVMEPVQARPNFQNEYKAPEKTPKLNSDIPAVRKAPTAQQPVATSKKEAEPVFQNLSPRLEPQKKSQSVEPVEKASTEKSPTDPSEKFLFEAKRKAAQTILQGELEAEKAVQSIYEKAKAAQKETDEKIAEQLLKAQQQAENLIVQAELESKEIVKEARRVAQTMRTEVEGYVEKIKDEVLAEAQAEKKEIIDNAESYVEEQNREVLRKAQKEAEEIKASALAFEKKLKNDLAELENSSVEKKNYLDKLVKDLDSLKAEITASEDRKKELVKFLEEGHQSQLDMTLKKQELEVHVDALRKLDADYSLKTEELKNGLDDLKSKFDSEKAQFSDKISREKMSLEKAEEDRREEIRLELQKQANKLEQQMLTEVVRSKEALIQDIHFSVEKEMANLVGSVEWAKISNKVKQQVVEAVEGKVAHLSSEAVGVQKASVVAKQRSKENSRTGLYGAFLGIALAVGAQFAWKAVEQNQSPMKARAIAAAEERQKDLEARKFNPTQVDEVKESYTDSIIYTRNFAALYTNVDIQKRFYKEASAYLLKTWRVEEEKAIEVISISISLVKELQERRDKIHPDYVKDGIQKMRDLEKTILARLKVALGSEVRVQSFKKFEAEFFTNEIKKSLKK